MEAEVVVEADRNSAGNTTSSIYAVPNRDNLETVLNLRDNTNKAGDFVYSNTNQGQVHLRDNLTRNPELACKLVGSGQLSGAAVGISYDVCRSAGVSNSFNAMVEYAGYLANVAGGVAGLSRGLAQIGTINLPSGNYYSVGYEMQLKSSSFLNTRYMHFKEANIALEGAMTSNPAVLQGLRIKIPRFPSGAIRGKSPEGWVWHHHSSRPGVMQLVPKFQHPNIPGGKFWDVMHTGSGRSGGYAIWGPGN